MFICREKGLWNLWYSSNLFHSKCCSNKFVMNFLDGFWLLLSLKIRSTSQICRIAFPISPIRKFPFEIFGFSRKSEADRGWPVATYNCGRKWCSEWSQLGIYPPPYINKNIKIICWVIHFKRALKKFLKFKPEITQKKFS